MATYAVYTSKDFRRNDGYYVIGVEDGVKGFSPWNEGWPTFEDAQQEMRRVNSEIGVSEEMARWIWLSSHVGVPAAQLIAEDNAGPEGEVMCAHGSPIGSSLPCPECAEQQRIQHRPELVGIKVAWTSTPVHLRCRLCGHVLEHAGHVGEPVLPATADTKA